MDVNKLGAGRGAGWYGEAWGIFKGQVGMWLLLVLVYLGIAIVLNLIPMIGGLVFTLIAPSLAGGIYLAAREAEAGRPLEVKLLFQPLLDASSRGPMLTLGAFSIAFSIVLALSFVAMLGSAAGSYALLGQDPEAMQALMAGTGLAGLLVLLLLSLVFMLAMLYATPLVLFYGVGPWPALGLSLKASLVNWLPLLLFSLILIPLGMLASIPLMLGWLFLLPILMIAVYVSFKEIFGLPAPAPRPQATVSF